MTLSRLLGWGHTQDLPNAVDQGNGAKKDPTTTTTTIPYPSEEVCGLMASGSTALCEAKGNLVSHAHPDVGPICCADPIVHFCFSGVSHLVNWVVRRQEAGLAGKAFYSSCVLLASLLLTWLGP